LIEAFLICPNLIEAVVPYPNVPNSLRLFCRFGYYSAVDFIIILP